MRAGSQRVKRKNERIINGKYLYEYIVDTLLHAKLVGNIIINTDITSVSNKYSENKKIIIRVNIIYRWKVNYINP